MKYLLWVPGYGHWRRGQRGTGASLFAVFAMLLALLVWRRDVIGQTASRTLALISWSDAPRMERYPDFLAGSIALLALLAGLAVGSRRAALSRSRDGEAGGTSPRRELWRRFRQNRLAVGGAVVIAALYAVALLCPLLAPHSPGHVGPAEASLLPPSMEHPLGTDDLSRDVLSRVLYGSRVSLLVGLLAMGLAVGIGTAYGALAGYCGGRIDGVLMRIVDAFLAFPTVVLLITVLGLWKDTLEARFEELRLDRFAGLDPWIWVISIVIGLTSWMGVARLVRGQFLVLKEREFIQAVRALGAGASRIVFRHLLPNSLTPIIVVTTLGVGNAILLEAALSYLGLGVQEPTPSWGNIVFDNKGAILSLEEWWIPFSAGLAIVLTVVGYNLLGDGLRDALDPRLKR